MSLKDVNPVVFGMGLVGTVFVWSAVHGVKITVALKDLLAGRPAGPGDPLQGVSVVADQAGTAAGAVVGSSAASVLGALGGATISHSAAGNRSNGQLQAAGLGWTGDQWAALDKLWTRESGWNNLARNPSSGAYGIPQALPEDKLPPAGRRSGGSDPTAQIQWGLSYIRGRYGNPAAAWAHETTNGWY